MNDERDKYRSLVQENYSNALAGNSNCIEFAFPKLRQFYPGHDKGMLLGITGSAKSGKTALTSHLIYYSTMDYLYKSNDKFPCHFLWFALEEPSRKFYARLDSYLLNKYYHKRVDYNTLMSKTAEKRMPKEIYDIWSSEEYRALFKFYTDNVTLVKYKKTAESIINEINEYASKLGKLTKESIGYNEKKNKYEAKVVISDKQNDLAIIKISNCEIKDYSKIS